MRRGAVGVDMGNVDGFLEFLGVLFARKVFVDAIKFLHRTFHPNLHATVGRIVRKDGHDDFHLAELFGQVVAFGEEVLQAVAKLLQSRVDEIGTHGVARVELHTNLIIVRDLCAVVDESHPKDATAALAHLFGHGIRVGQQAFLDFGEQSKEFFLVAAPAEMYLSDLAHVDDLSMEATAFAPKLGRSRGSSHDGTLLDDHGHDIILAVDGHIGRDAVGDEEIGDGVLAELVKQLLLLRVGMPVAFQQANDLARVLEVVGNKLQLLFLEKFGEAFLYAFASSHFSMPFEKPMSFPRESMGFFILLPFFFFKNFFRHETLLKFLPPILCKGSDLVQIAIPNRLIHRIFLIHPFFTRVVGLGLLHEVGEGIAHTAFAHLNGEIVGNPRPFRLHCIAVVQLELVFAFKGASVVLLENGGRALVVGVHKAAIDTVKYLILRAYSVADDFTESDFFRLWVNGQLGRFV